MKGYPLDKARIAELYHAGWKAKDIAAEMGCSIQAIWNNTRRIPYKEDTMKLTYKCNDTRSCCFRSRGECRILSDPPLRDGQCAFAKRLVSGKTYQRKVKKAEQDNRPFWMKWPYLGRFR